LFKSVRKLDGIGEYAVHMRLSFTPIHELLLEREIALSAALDADTMQGKPLV